MAYRGNRNVVHKFPSFLEYKSPTTLEMCDIVTYRRGSGWRGACAWREGSWPHLQLPVPPAIANAVYDAVGVRIDEIPITPDKVLKAIRDKAKGKEGRFGPDEVPLFHACSDLLHFFSGASAGSRSNRRAARWPWKCSTPNSVSSKLVDQDEGQAHDGG